MKITSLQNETIKKYAQLKTKKYRDEAKEFIVEGYHLVKEALNSNLVKKIFYTDLKDLEVNDIECIEVSENVLAKLSSTVSPQGVVAIVSFFDNDNLNISSFNKIVALDHVQDPGNAGTIVRSAKAFGFDLVLFSEESVDIYNDKFIRSTQGYFFKIPFVNVNLKETLLKLKENHTLIATHLSSYSQTPEDINTSSSFVLVLGNEGNGVSEKILEICDKNVIIPMEKGVDSLNVGIAGSILMYLWRNK